MLRPRPTVVTTYAATLKAEGVLTPEEEQRRQTAYAADMEAALKARAEMQPRQARGSEN